MAAPCGDVGGISGGGQNPIAFKLHSRDWKILLGTMALMITLGSVTVTIMFYVLTPKQTHDADIARVDTAMAVAGEKHKAVLDDIEDIESDSKDLARSLRRIERRQDMVAPKRVRREVPLPDEPSP